jgi:hypothetical protein
MIARVKDYVCLTSISVALSVAVKVIQLVRPTPHVKTAASVRRPVVMLRDLEPAEH